MNKLGNYKNMIGDYKLPNKYWISVGNEYYIQRGNYLDWFESEDIEFKGGTIAKFDTYKEAKEFAEGLYLGQKYEDFTINCITIEDRITGQLYEHIKVFLPEQGKFTEEIFEDTHFTEKHLQEKNKIFA